MVHVKSFMKMDYLMFKVETADGKIAGPISVYDSIGKPTGEIDLDKKLSGTITINHKNGKTFMIIPLEKGKVEGILKVFHENGQMEAQGHIEKNTLIGIWQFYDDNGNGPQLKTFNQKDGHKLEFDFIEDYKKLHKRFKYS